VTPAASFNNFYDPTGTAPSTIGIVPFAPLSSGQPLTLGQLATFLNAVNTTALSSGAVTSLATGLSSSVYGIWASNDTGSSGRVGVFATGNPTPTASMPTNVTATYNGSTIGVAGSPSASYAVTGTVQLTATFATGNVTTTISNLQFQNTATNAITNQPNLTGLATISPTMGNQYGGPLSSAALTGTSTGTFYGPAAKETAGVWNVSGGGLTAIGSYGAKQ
jgi:hypothetical protein